MVPEITTSKGYPISLGPLSVILCISALKDFVEDFSRHKEDEKENCLRYKVSSDKVKFKEI